MSLGRKIAVIAVIVTGLLVLNHVFEYGFGDFQINPYYARIINLIGINITLAVSLNLINGLTGQFSIGHAGFMAVGGYTATYLTVYHGRQIAALVGSTPTDPARRLGCDDSEPAGRRSCRGARGIAGRHSVAAAERGLPRDRHAGLQRDHPRDHPQHSGRWRRHGIHRRDSHYELLLDLLDGDAHDRHHAQHRDCPRSAARCLRFAATRLRPRRWASTPRETR